MADTIYMPSEVVRRFVWDGEWHDYDRVGYWLTQHGAPGGTFWDGMRTPDEGCLFYRRGASGRFEMQSEERVDV